MLRLITFAFLYAACQVVTLVSPVENPDPMKRRFLARAGILGDIIIVRARLSTILFICVSFILGPGFHSRPFGLE
jgi:hypothetical protein